MKLEELFNRDQAAERESRRAALTARLEPYRGRNDIYISMRGINKVGLNPSSRHNSTPMGIYAYQLTDDMFEKAVSHNLPYLSWEKYVAVIKGSPDGQLRSDQTDKAFALMEQLPTPSQRSLEVAKDQRRLATGALRDLLVKSNALAFDAVQDTSYTPAVCVKWASILRQLGLQSIRDDDTGSLFSIEPTQTVFFSIKPVTVLEVIRNKSEIYHRELVSFKQMADVAAKLPKRLAAMWISRAILDGDLPDLEKQTDIQLPNAIDRNMRFSRTQVRELVNRLQLSVDDEMMEWLDGAPIAFYEEG